MRRRLRPCNLCCRCRGKEASAEGGRGLLSETLVADAAPVTVELAR
jgi:hypothetical protein